MMTEAQRQLLEEFNAREPNWQEPLDATRRVVKWIEQVTVRQAQPKASLLYHDRNLLMMGKSSPEGRRLH
jgi:uncharacterized NAD(P)/FAD-binding protein YdhS